MIRPASGSGSEMAEPGEFPVVDQGKGLGKALLKDAMLRAVMVADIAGYRAFLVHAKDDQAKKWYQQSSLEPSPTDPLHLMIPLKDLIHATC